MRRPELKSTFARAVVPVLAGIGFFAVVGLLLWGVAAVISRNSDDTTERLAPSFQQMGRVDFISAQITDGGPIILQDLIGDDDNIVLDYTEEAGFEIYLAHPADRDASCQIVQVKGTRLFTDCEGRTLEPADLAPPPAGVNPVINPGDNTLTLDLTADEPAEPATTVPDSTSGTGNSPDAGDASGTSGG
ncbi:MAG: hypothetical protein Q7V88_01010 [Actinomycetota bacterium]|nr:hypothetical protein [Actinomycetota bacterium]